MVFCNYERTYNKGHVSGVTILILIDGFLQYVFLKAKKLQEENVTILILIDGFLQYLSMKIKIFLTKGHNPYFNRWFSAITYMPLKR